MGHIHREHIQDGYVISRKPIRSWISDKRHRTADERELWQLCGRRKRLTLPISRVLDRFHMPLANHEFLPAVQDEQPAMAAQRNHLF